MPHLSILLLASLCSCTHDIDLGRLDAGPEDADSDSPDGDGERPIITGVEGTGTERPPSIDGNDLEVGCAATLPEERIGATRRIATDSPALVVTGQGLEDTSVAAAVGACGQGSIQFEIEEEGMNEVRLRFPEVLTITAGGLFMLTLLTPQGNAEAQLFILQGEQGEPGADANSALSCNGSTCTLNQNLIVGGEITGTTLNITGAATFGSVTVHQTIWLPECPVGYSRVTEQQDFIVCTDGTDEMVKVGDFWVDRYEASVWSDAECSQTQHGAADDWPEDGSFPFHGGLTTRLFACSVPAEVPSRWITWFQAQAACAASGKRLLTNAEWQAAAAGTVDPGECITAATEVAATGAGRCPSFWGAEDMVGNVWEWVADWYGQGEDDSQLSQGTPYFLDMYENGDPAQYGGALDEDGLFPAAGLRGGSYLSGEGAGVFALSMAFAPSYRDETMGFRCARDF